MELQLDFGLNKTDKLLRKFEEIHNFIYANDGLSTQQTLEEFIKLLFIKILDEREKNKIFKISSEEFELIKNSKKTNNFSSRINELFNKTKIEYADLFDKDEKIRISDSSLGFIVNKLQDISLTNSSSDAKGLAFQKFLSHQEKDGRGQFFTPEPIIDFCVKIIQPKLNETIIDPACGSGGFLFSALEFIKMQNVNCNLSDIIKNNIYGIDINKSIARIAKMKLILEANVETNISNTNSLNNVPENNVPEYRVALSPGHGGRDEYGRKTTGECWFYPLNKFSRGYSSGTRHKKITEEKILNLLEENQLIEK